MDIRKVSIGSDYKASMHYIVGQAVGRGAYTIHLIMYDNNSNSIKIWIEDDSEAVILWKEFTSTMPVSIEYNIEF